MVRTLGDLFFHVRERFAGKPDLLEIQRGGKLERVSTERFVSQVHALALALDGRGLRRGERLAIFSENCPEWLITDFACQLLGLVSVPIYPTLPAEQLAALLGDSGARWIVYRDRPKRAIVAAARARLERELHAVAIEEDAVEESGLTLFQLAAEGERRTAEVPLETLVGHAREDDLASLIYTSGTTGEPKGVMLTHGNFVSNMLACAAVFGFGPRDVALSFLPLSHVFERTCCHVFLYSGMTIHTVPSIERVPPLLPEVRPTVLTSVPRLFERVYLRVLGNVAKQPPRKQRVFRWAVEVGRRVAADEERGRGPGVARRLQYGVADRLVFRQIRERFGGRLKVAMSGGAPLPRQVGEFFAGAGLPLYQGYGLTESSPVLAANHAAAHRQGSVGRAVPGVELRIAADGEILARGPGIMRGYWQKPEASAEAIDGEGWLHTGDVGYLDEDGFLFITDRKKDLLVTSGGKNVAPQAVEKALLATGLVSQAVAVGDRYPYVTALLVPNPEYFAAELGESDVGRLAARPEVEDAIEKAVASANRGLAEHERVRRFRLLPRELTIEAGELTPTLKVRRRVVLERYKETIASMYLKSQRLDGEGRERNSG